MIRVARNFFVPWKMPSRGITVFIQLLVCQLCLWNSHRPGGELPDFILATLWRSWCNVLPSDIGWGEVRTNPGAGNRLIARVLAGGLRLVTEGYSGKPPQPPTLQRVTPSGHFHSIPTDPPVIYGVFCWRRSKYIVFLRCLGPFRVQECYPGTVIKHRLLRGFGVQAGARTGKNDMLKVF